MRNAERGDRTRPPAGAVTARVRFDRWLWAARFYRTRSLAAQAIDAGQARIGGERVKTAHPVRVGDAVTIRKSGLAWDVEVIAVDDRRGDTAAAATLYRETEASAKARAEETSRRRAAAGGEPRYPGRPTKRQRRALDDLLNER